ARSLSLLHPLLPSFPTRRSSDLASFVLLTLLLVWSLHEHWRRRIAENELRQRLDELAQVNRFATAGELTASIAHEIRQPLAAIRSEEHTSELQSHLNLVCRLLLE